MAAATTATAEGHGGDAAAAVEAAAAVSAAAAENAAEGPARAVAGAGAGGAESVAGGAAGGDGFAADGAAGRAAGGSIMTMVWKAARHRGQLGASGLRQEEERLDMCRRKIAGMGQRASGGGTQGAVGRLRPAA